MRHSVAALGGAALRSGAWSLALEAGPLVTVTLRSDVASPAGLTPTRDRSVVSGGLMVQGLGSARVGARAHVDVAAGIAALWPGEVYAVEGASPAVLLTPYRAQPFVGVGLGYDLW